MGHAQALLLVGSLPHSGKWRAVLAPSVEQPHLFEAMITVVGLLGGTTKIWRFDRMSTVYNVSSGDVNTVFAGFAKHYGVQVALCPPRSGHRKGVVEKNNHTAAQRWWRTLPDETTCEQGQASVAAFATSQDGRQRRTLQGKSTTTAMAADEVLAALPVPYPATISESRSASRQALVLWREKPILRAIGTSHREIWGTSVNNSEEFR